jgi:myosin heavy subunit
VNDQYKRLAPMNGSYLTRSGTRIRRGGAPAGVAQPEPSASYMEIARRWWWALLACTLLGLGAAVAYVKYGPMPNDSTALILVPADSDLSADPLGSPSRLRGAAANFAAQAVSPQMQQLVSTALQGKLDLAPRDLAQMIQDKRITIQAQRDTNTINVTATDPNPDTARLLANTFASVLVDDVNTRAKSDLDLRKQQLSQQIEQTRGQLVTAQLQQRAQDLTKELRDQRGQLLQLQFQYQQELQQQAQAKQLQALAAAPAPTPPAPDPDVQLQLQQLADTSATSQAQTIDLLNSQQADLQTTINNLSGQLDSVHAALRRLPTATTATTNQDQQQQLQQLQQVQRDRQQGRKQLQDQRTQLTQQEQSLTRQAQAQTAQLRQLQIHFQQEQQRLTDLDQRRAQLQAQVKPQVTADQITDATAAIASQRQVLDLVTSQQQDLNQALALTNQQLDSVHLQLAQLPVDVIPAPSATDVDGSGDPSQADQPPDPTQLSDDDLQSQIQQLQQQLVTQDLTAKQVQGQQAQLQQQEQNLTQQLQAQRNMLRQVQLQYQQEIQRQAGNQQRVLAATPRPDPTPQPKLTDDQLSEIKQADDAAQRVRKTWFDVIAQQQQDVQANISDLSQQLASVQSSLDALPAKSDPALAAAFAQAYAHQLQDLTGQYIGLEANPQATNLLERYGDASDPLPANGAKKIAALGMAGGLALGAGLAYLLELIRRRRVGRALVLAEQGLPLPEAEQDGVAGLVPAGRRGRAPTPAQWWGRRPSRWSSRAEHASGEPV